MSACLTAFLTAVLAPFFTAFLATRLAAPAFTVWPLPAVGPERTSSDAFHASTYSVADSTMYLPILA
ncbi:hypothetical protein D3C78_1897430 [compost metagenome]